MADESLERDQPEATVGSDGGRGLGRFTAGILFGAVLGAGLALLFAPERGDATRRRLRKRLARLRKRAESGLDRASVRGRRRLEEALERARDLRG